MNYKFKTKPYEHQKDALGKCWNKEAFAIFAEMGTGKTKVLIDNIAMLYDHGKIDGALIIAPKGVMGTWFDTEIPLVAPALQMARLCRARWSRGLRGRRGARWQAAARGTRSAGGDRSGTGSSHHHDQRSGIHQDSQHLGRGQPEERNQHQSHRGLPAMNDQES